MMPHYSEGKCLYCSETFEKSKISRHLINHIKEKAEGKKTGKSFYLIVECSEMFLSFWVDGKASFDDLDDYLRQLNREIKKGCLYKSSLSL